MTWLIWLGVALGALLFLLLALTLFFFRLAIVRSDKYTADDTIARMEKIHSPEHMRLIKEGRHAFLSAPREEVYISSRDGLTLHGTLFPKENARGTLVLVHGWRSQAETDFSVSFPYYQSKGLNVLAITQRAHGKSEGKYICFGTKERFDLVDWLKFVNSRFGEQLPILISGISMGASTVMMALGEAELPSNVAAATADCGFVSAWEQFAHVLRHSYHLPPFPLLFTAELLSRLVADFPFRAITTEQALAAATVPVLFLHGLDDDFVPPEHSRRSAAACASPHELIEVAGADHGMSYLVDTPLVSHKLDAFFEKALGAERN